MALDPDDTVCYCFHVSFRKVETFCHVTHPRVASQISQCLSAGTGCGWCIPLLKKIHAQQSGQDLAQANAPGTGPLTSADIDDAAAYAEARRQYIERKKEPT